MKGFFRWALVVGLAGCELNCTQHDGDARVTLPPEAIAAGAFFPLGVSDRCRGGGKVNFCGTEDLVSIDTIAVEDPRVAAVLRMEELPDGVRTSDMLVVDAKAAGTSKVTIDSTFDDGSQRQAEAEIVVQKADGMELVHGCLVDEPGDVNLFPVGWEASLRVDLFAGKNLLRGEHRKELLAGAGVARQAGALRENPYTWTAPASAGETLLTSPLLPKFKATFRAYELTSVSIDSVARMYEEPVTYDNGVLFRLELSTAGKRPCEFPPLRIATSTPDVCSGADKELTWLVERPTDAFAVRAWDSGSCEFTVSVEGTDTTFPVQVELEVTDVPPPDPCEGVVCEDISSCPDGSELARRDCCNSCVPVPNAKQCEVERSAFDELYASQLPAAQACKVDRDCGPVVLVGGCRRYCFIPVNFTLTADFMNAVSLDYHTSCPSCQVDQPADCTGYIGAHCDAGLCTLDPPSD